MQKRHKEFPNMRVYINKDLDQAQDNFAPIVNKLRVMPQERV